MVMHYLIINYLSKWHYSNMEAIILYLQIIDGQMDGSMGGQESLMSLVHKQIQIDLQRPRH